MRKIILIFFCFFSATNFAIAETKVAFKVTASKYGQPLWSATFESLKETDCTLVFKENRKARSDSLTHSECRTLRELIAEAKPSFQNPTHLALPSQGSQSHEPTYSLRFGEQEQKTSFSAPTICSLNSGGVEVDCEDKKLSASQKIILEVRKHYH